MTISLQRCGTCAAFQYPSRDVCWRCLSDDLRVEQDSGRGELLATTLVHRSLDSAFAADLPFRLGTIRLDCGPHLIGFVAEPIEPGRLVIVEVKENARGERVFSVSRPGDGSSPAAG